MFMVEFLKLLDNEFGLENILDYARTNNHVHNSMMLQML